jgi:O-antigen/teichoic acid export membrane protein
MRLEVDRLVRGTIWVSASRVIEGVIALFFSIVVARWLGGDYGFVGAAMGIFGILNVVSRLGIPQASTRFVAHLSAKGENMAARMAVRRTLALEGALTVCASIALFLLRNVLAEDVFGKPGLADPLLIVSPMLFLAGVGGVWLSTFQGLHRYGVFSLLVTVNPVVRMGSAVIFLFLGWGVEGALLGYLAGHAAATLLGTGLGLVLVPRDLPIDRSEEATSKDPARVSELLKFGSAVMVGTMAVQIFEWTDKLMLTAWQPIEEVAFYTIAFGMVSLPLLIPRAIHVTFYPTISSLHGAGDAEGLRKATERVMRFTMVLMAFIPLAMMAIAPWVVGLLYGELFLPAVAPFMILSVWGLIRPVGLIAYSIPKGVGRPIVGAGAMVMTAVLNVGLNAMLIPAWGTVGAAVATTISYVVGFTYLTIVALRMVDASFPWSPVVRAVGSALVAALAMLVAFLLLPGVDPEGPSWALILPVIVVGFMGLAIYIVLLGFTRAVTHEDADLVSSLGIPGSRWLQPLVMKVASLGGQKGSEGRG